MQPKAYFLFIIWVWSCLNAKVNKKGIVEDYMSHRAFNLSQRDRFGFSYSHCHLGQCWV